MVIMECESSQYFHGSVSVREPVNLHETLCLESGQLWSARNYSEKFGGFLYVTIEL